MTTLTYTQVILRALSVFRSNIPVTHEVLSNCFLVVMTVGKDCSLFIPTPELVEHSED